MKNLLLDKPLNKLIKLTINPTHPKEELRYLHWNKSAKTYEATDAMSLISVSPKQTEDIKPLNTLIAINESKHDLLYPALTDEKFPNLQRVIPNNDFLIELESFNEFIRFKTDKMYLDIENKKIYNQLMHIRKVFSNETVRYYHNEIVFVVKINQVSNGIECDITYVFMGFNFS